MQNAESDANRGDHNKSEEGVVTLVIACLSTAKFLEAIEETRYYIPPFIRLIIKRPSEEGSRERLFLNNCFQLKAPSLQPRLL